MNRYLSWGWEQTEEHVCWIGICGGICVRICWMGLSAADDTNLILLTVRVRIYSNNHIVLPHPYLSGLMGGDPKTQQKDMLKPTRFWSFVPNEAVSRKKKSIFQQKLCYLMPSQASKPFCWWTILKIKEMGSIEKHHNDLKACEKGGRASILWIHCSGCAHRPQQLNWSVVARHHNHCSLCKGQTPTLKPNICAMPFCFYPYFNPLLIRHWMRTFEALLCSVADPP